ncbi:hypothetical protein DY218_29335 [Streptomyces triticagri]|uniref:LPXTG cell wall anchor domain-containing protein n=1 Tax=Streptomyces triticagri TaxID=2293568 RepID=A0A372LWW8_9ACTN|nr:hypothetical protein [Streptomyces triticagri]RFU83141.1 hypothetical protein DY218_29335 [Streptomyces triticagri]
MTVARRFVITASAAGSLLTALWFVPSADATPDLKTQQVEQEQQARQAIHGQAAAAEDGAGAAQADAPRLADTGSVDTTPYLIGGTAFLGVGAAFVARSVHRGRTGTA